MQALATDVEHVLVQALPILDLLDESDETTPAKDDVRAVRSAGWPWSVVAEVAGVFSAIERGGAEAMARRLLRPDGFPEALFQLSVLGAVLLASEKLGARITSLRPIGYMTDGPVYTIDLQGRGSWDLWCEAANCWAIYDVVDHYKEFAASLTMSDGRPFRARNIRPDVVLAQRGHRALVLECKFPSESLDPGYVAHGLYQAVFYAHQLMPAFQSVSGFAVGPGVLVPGRRDHILGEVRVGVVGPSDLESLVSELMFTEGERARADLSAEESTGNLTWPFPHDGGD
ncbi:hypothetical protein [Kribbella sp. C-35]|uniref:hypothetical protein n=1 Tax=Kribbella sp. C-35 TaxID=2789276 RepID=UPI00397D9570